MIKTKDKKNSVKKWVGAHVSISGGVENAPLEAKEMGATAFAMFPKNQRQWKAAPYSEANIERFHQFCKDNGFRPEMILPHSSYLINLGNCDNVAQEKSLDAFVDEINRCHQLGLHLLNIHPGAHLNKISEDACLSLIAQNINKAISSTKKVKIVLESTAGQGSCVGHRFEHLKRIIDEVEDKSRIGVCLDTCHIYSAGYNIKEHSGFLDTMDQFSETVGFNYLMGMHLNDSKAKLGQRVDRHHSLGKGEIGLDVFKWIMQDKRFDGIPLILETIDTDLWPDEIKLLFSYLS